MTRWNIARIWQGGQPASGPLDFFRLAVQAGEVEGVSIMHGKGEREAMGTTASGEDIWRGNDLSNVPAALASTTTIPVPAAAGEPMTVICEHATDIIDGVGAQKVTVVYLDPTGVQKSVERDTNGTTGVPLPDGVLPRFIQDMYVSQVGSNGVAVGNIRIFKTAGNTLVYSMIAAGSNMSLVINKMIPLGYTLFLQQWHVEEAQIKRCAFRMRSTDFAGVLNAGAFLIKDTAYVKGSASGPIPTLHKIPELSIIKVSAWPDENLSEGSAGWWGYLVSNAMLTS